jgi:hypothetical protein
MDRGRSFAWIRGDREGCGGGIGRQGDVGVLIVAFIPCG